jgi:hypothetical protein
MSKLYWFVKGCLFDFLTLKRLEPEKSQTWLLTFFSSDIILTTIMKRKWKNRSLWGFNWTDLNELFKSNQLWQSYRVLKKTFPHFSKPFGLSFQHSKFEVCQISRVNSTRWLSQNCGEKRFFLPSFTDFVGRVFLGEEKEVFFGFLIQMC